MTEQLAAMQEDTDKTKPASPVSGSNNAMNAGAMTPVSDDVADVDFDASPVPDIELAVSNEQLPEFPNIDVNDVDAEMP